MKAKGRKVVKWLEITLLKESHWASWCWQPGFGAERVRWWYHLETCPSSRPAPSKQQGKDPAVCCCTCPDLSQVSPGLFDGHVKWERKKCVAKAGHGAEG